MKIIKQLQNTEWTTIKHLDREVSVEVADRAQFTEFLKNNDKFTVAICDATSPLNFLLDIEGFFTVSKSALIDS